MRLAEEGDADALGRLRRDAGTARALANGRGRRERAGRLVREAREPVAAVARRVRCGGDDVPERLEVEQVVGADVREQAQDGRVAGPGSDTVSGAGGALPGLDLCALAASIADHVLLAQLFGGRVRARARQEARGRGERVRCEDMRNRARGSSVRGRTGDACACELDPSVARLEHVTRALRTESVRGRCEEQEVVTDLELQDDAK
jgi:hypothetical protein